MNNGLSISKHEIMIEPIKIFGPFVLAYSNTNIFIGFLTLNNLIVGPKFFRDL
jgi:hypothetical protein